MKMLEMFEIKSDQNGIERLIDTTSQFLKLTGIKSDQNGIERECSY